MANRIKTLKRYISVLLVLVIMLSNMPYNVISAAANDVAVQSEEITGQKEAGEVEAKPEAEGEAKPEAEGEAKPEAEVEAKPEAEVEAKPEAEGEAKPEAEVEAKPEAEVEAKPEAEVEAKPEGEVEAEPETDGEAKPEEEEKAAETFSFEVKVSEIKENKGIVALLGDFFGDKETCADLDVEVTQADGTAFDPPVTGKTDEDGCVSFDTVPASDAGYRVYISGFKGNYEVVGQNWVRQGAKFYKDFSDRSELEDGITIEIKKLAETEYFGMSPNIKVDGKHKSGVKLTLIPLDENGTPVPGQSDEQYSDAYGYYVWDELPRELKYRLVVEAPDQYTYLKEVSTTLTEHVYNESLSGENGEGKWEYVFDIDPNSEALKNSAYYYGVIDFTKVKTDIEVTKEFAQDISEDSKAKDLWIGILSSDDTKIIWQKIDRSAGDKAVFEAVNKIQESLLDNGVVKSGSQLSYTLFEYTSNEMEPEDSANWTMVSQKVYNAPEGGKNGYSLWMRKDFITFDTLKDIYSEAIKNAKSDWKFGGTNETIEGFANPTIFRGWKWDWKAKKTVSINNGGTYAGEVTKALEKGEEFTANYKIEFDRTGPTEVTDATLYFNDIKAILVYDKRAAVGDNYVQGIFELYKNDSKIAEYAAPERLLTDYDTIRAESELLMYYKSIQLKDSNYTGPAKYTVKFTGSYNYNQTGDINETMETKPITLSVNVNVHTDINDVPSTPSNEAKDKILKDYTDVITLPENLVNIGEPLENYITNVKVDNVSKTYGTDYTLEKTGNKVTIKFKEGQFNQGPNNSKITVTYDVKYKDTTEKIPCQAEYEIKNVAAAKTYDNNMTVTDSAKITVEVPTYAFFTLEKFLVTKNPLKANGAEPDKPTTSAPEADIKFRLYDGANWVASAETTGTGKVIIMAGTDFKSITWNDLQADKIDEIFTPVNGTKYELRLYENENAGMYIPEGWQRNTSDKYWYKSIEATKDCGPTDITVNNVPPGINISKSGVNADTSDFYAEKDGNIWRFEKDGETSPGIYRYKAVGLEAGKYTIYEVTSSNARPTGSWTEVTGNDIPAAIKAQNLTGKTVYKKDTELNHQGYLTATGTSVTNEGTNDLTITKNMVGATHTGNDVEFIFKVSKDPGMGTPLYFTYASGVYTYSASGVGASPDIKIMVGSGGTASAVIKGLPAGDYYVKEDPITVNTADVYDIGYMPTDRKAVIGWGTGIPGVMVTNKLLNAQITVKKLCTENPTETFEFEIWDGAVKLTQSGISGVTLNSNGNFELKNGGTATITGLIPGKNYTIKEVNAGNYNTTYAIAGGTSVSGKEAAVTAKKAADADTITFTNTLRTDAKLRVSKELTAASPEDKSTVFTFQTDIPNGIKGILVAGGRIGTEITVTSGKFELYAGETIEFEGLTVGKEYTVTETDIDAKYSLISSDTKGTAKLSNPDTIAFINQRKMTGIIKVKKVVDSSLETDKDISFRFTISPVPAGESGSFTLKANETKTFTGLPLGEVYTITEVTETNFASVSKITSTDPTIDGTITDKITAKAQTDTLVFTNTRNKGELTITKSLPTGWDAGDDFTFVLYSDAVCTNPVVEAGITGPDGTFKLTKTAPSVTFTSVLAGATYYLEETGGINTKYELVIYSTGGKDKGEAEVGKVAEIKVTNKRVTDGSASLTKSADVWPNGGFKFQLYRLDGNTWEKVGNEETLTAANATKTWENLWRGATYRIYEIDPAGYVPQGWTEATDGRGAYYDEFTVSEDTMYTKLINLKNENTKITVKKEVTNAVTNQAFKFQILDSSGNAVSFNAFGTDWVYDAAETGAKEFDIEHGKTADFLALPLGDYTVIETDPLGFKPSITPGAVQLTPTSLEWDVIIENELEAGYIKISKETDGYVDEADKFTIDVEGYFLDAADNTYKISTKSYVFAKNPAAGEYAVGDVVTVDAAQNQEYRVEEKHDAVSGKYDISYSSQTATGAAAESSAQTVTVTNTRRTGTVELTKEVLGEMYSGIANADKKFAVYLKSDSGGYLEFDANGGFTGVNPAKTAAAKVTAEKDVTAVLTGIPAGFKLTCEEELADNSYTVKYTYNGDDNAPEIEPGATLPIVVENTVVTRLEIVKNVKDENSSSAAGTYTFNIYANGEKVPVKLENGVYVYDAGGSSFDIQVTTSAAGAPAGMAGTGSVYVYGLEYGTDYKAEEDTAKLTDRYYLDKIENSAIRFELGAALGGSGAIAVKSAHTVTAVNGRSKETGGGGGDGGSSKPDGDLTPKTVERRTIADNKIPLAKVPDADVPKAGGMPIEALGIAGIAAIGLGIALKRKKKEEE